MSRPQTEASIGEGCIKRYRETRIYTGRVRDGHIPFDSQAPGMAYSLMSGDAITAGLIVSLILLSLIAIFGPAIRDWYRSARDKMRTSGVNLLEVEAVWQC